jgi:hypothetical protein
MGIYHLSVKTLKRASGRTPQSASAYRRGIRLVGPDGRIHDYRRRTRGIRATAIFAPEGCEWVQDPQALWDRADAAERRQDSRTAREYEVALPAELPWSERQRLAEAFAQHLVAQFGVAVDLAIHEPAADGEHDERNHHAHLLTTTRSVTPDGMGKKTRDLDVKTTSPALIEALRAEWARMANEALARHNAAQIDHRSHKRRELEVIPTKHEGPKVTWWRRLRAGDEDWPDGFMDRARENEEIRSRNVTIIERIQRTAAAARKNVGGFLKGLVSLPMGFEPPPAQSLTDAEIIRGIEAAKPGGMPAFTGMLADQGMPPAAPLPPTDSETRKDVLTPRETIEDPSNAQEVHVDAEAGPIRETETTEQAEDVDGTLAPDVALEPVNGPSIGAPENTSGRRRRPR